VHRGVLLLAIWPPSFAGVYFRSSIRQNPATGKFDGYYRLIESYRNLEGRACHRTLLNIGFLENVDVDQLNEVQAILNARHRKLENLFEEFDPFVVEMADSLWRRLVSEKRIDVDWADKAARRIDVDTIRHSNVREVGTEWMCFNTWNQLQISEFLRLKGWSETQIQLAMTQVISRAAYPASELKTTLWAKQNSAVCELTGYDMEQLTKDKLYKSALDLYAIKDPLEQHLSQRTNTLFDLEDKIILYDLTNTYFEGRKLDSELAKHGRSKEKRADAKLIVLAMVVNVEGFIKYTSIHEGNIADCKTLSAMVEKLSSHTVNRKAIVVLDAGIATEENLKLLQSKGYFYVCVSRTKLKDYQYVKGRLNVLLETKGKHEVLLKALATDVGTDYYLEVTSPAKALKEGGMKNRFEARYEEELQKIKRAIDRKGGVKRADKVGERIGRAKEKYGSVHGYYHIHLTTDERTQQVTAMTWEKDLGQNQQKLDGLGVYFLRTNLPIKEEGVIWNIYNTIREIESTFRTLKTDLDLRPIYHRNDASTMAHLHLGILAYWLVNTIRHQLKAQGINSGWQEIVRIGNTQKMVTTSGQNTFDQVVTVRKCSEPDENLKKILDILKAKHRPFKKIKSVVHKPPPQNQKTTNFQRLSG
jgi:transposase